MARTDFPGYGAGSSKGQIGDETFEERGRQMRDAAEQPRSPLGAEATSLNRALRPNVRTCQSCAHYVGKDMGELSGKCTVGALTSPITGERFGGRPSEPRHWQYAQELRTAPPIMTSCGQYGEQWEAIF